MSLASKNQTKLYGLESFFNELKNLYDKGKLPNKILLSGLKGLGKCTLAYHLINYVLSIDEEKLGMKKNAYLRYKKVNKSKLAQSVEYLKSKSFDMTNCSLD